MTASGERRDRARRRSRSIDDEGRPLDSVVLALVGAVAIGAFVVTYTSAQVRSRGDVLGMWFMPRVSAVIVGIGAALALQTVRRHSSPGRVKHYRATILPLLVGLAYIHALLNVGFVVSTLSLQLFVLWSTGVRTPWKLIVTATSCTAGCYLLFVVALDVYLPRPWLF